MFNTNLFAKDNQILYSGENISNYFLGIMSANQDYNDMAFKYLKKAESLKDKHSQYNVEFVRTLILLEKFERAFDYSKSVWTKDVLFFEIYL